ncbi:aminotransferase class V [Wolbachia pipientis]|uniref:Cysteine desulfurase n=1 Tax=Wolbachia pipientis TaxID=955 RepID=A0A1E7QKS6_WOLPI|nr:cysteine desulfurase family protein [Wolbachia pipientis]OEY87053.1 aminotransferase class V [Wolbachia pipientis]
MKYGYIYADYNATAPISENIKQAISEVLSLQTLNPSSLHQGGLAARKILQNTRDSIYNFMGVCKNKKIVFTSSATEANNLAMNGLKDHIHVVSAIEHPSILYSANKPYIIPVNRDGVIELIALEKTLEKLRGNKVLVSVMLANNETGVIQPIHQISEIAHSFGAICHTDAVQGIGKITVNMEDLGVDLLTLSAHKIGGIAGSGVLIFDKQQKIEPIIYGGGQENGLRGGTENIVAIAALSAALHDVPKLLAKMKEVETLRNRLEYELLSLAHDIVIFGKNSHRLPNTSYIYMPGVKSDVQLMNFDLNNIAVSNGSACSAGRVESSHVLLAMGATKEQAECSLRVSIGWNTTYRDIEKIKDCWYAIYGKHIKLSTKK